MTKFILFYPKFKNEHSLKGLGMIPKYLHKNHNIDPYIITYKNENKYNIYEWLNLLFIKWNIVFFFIKTLIKINPKHIMFSHIKIETLIFSIISKIVRPKIKILIRWDANFRPAWKLNWRWKYLWPIINRVLYFIIPKYSTITIETYHSLNYIEQNYGVKLFHQTNWYDWSKDMKIDLLKKENIVTTISRLWTFDKNTELFLDVAKYVINKNNEIKFIAIGNINNDTNFIDYLEKFKKNNPTIIKNISFVWYKEWVEKISFFQKSKFLLMTSRYEWFANVFPEAAYYWNLIVSTDVWWAFETTNKGTLWKVLDCKKEEEFIEKAWNYILDNINKPNIGNDLLKQSNFIKENMLYEDLIKKLFNKIK